MKLYLLIALGALILGAYFYGAKTADAKCNIKNLKEDIQIQKQFNNKQKVIHETVYKTGVADIRRILCDKYTIAE